MLKKNILLFALLLFSHKSFVQENRIPYDEMIEELINLDYELVNEWNRNPIKGHERLHELLKRAPAKQKIYLQILKIYDACHIGNIKQGLATIKELKPQIEKSKFYFLKHYFYLNCGNFYGSYENFELAKINIELSLKFASNKNERDNCRVVLCNVYLRTGMQKNVIEIFEKNLEEEKKMDDLSYIFYDYYMLTQAYMQNRDFDKANIILQDWNKLILGQKINKTEFVDFANYYYLFRARYDIETNHKNSTSNIESNLKLASKGDFSDEYFSKNFLKTKLLYFESRKLSDSSAFYRNKLNLHLDAETKKNLQLTQELEQEEKDKTQQEQQNIILAVLSLVIFIGFSSYFIIKRQRNKDKRNLESREEILVKYSGILKEKYEIINQAEAKLNELQREIKDANFGKKIRAIKSSITLSETELKFLRELNNNELMSYEKIRSTLSQFTETEIRIVFLILKEKSINQIADILNISTKATENHRYRIRKKLSLSQEQSLENTLRELLRGK